MKKALFMRRTGPGTGNIRYQLRPDTKSNPATGRSRLGALWWRRLVWQHGGGPGWHRGGGHGAWLRLGYGA